MSVLLRAFVAAQEPSYTFTIIAPPNATGTTPTGINARGQIIGYYFTTGATVPPQPHGFLFEKGTFTPLNVPGAAGTTATAINARGQIVGSYTTGTGFPLQSHGFLFEKGTFTPLDVPGAASTTPTGINARGQIIGVADGHGFLATPTKP
jgi:probable HAF family extracellular repeat protein